MLLLSSGRGDKMAIKVLLWDKIAHMDKYEEYISEIKYSDNIIIFKTDDSELKTTLNQIIPDIFVADISHNREEKIKCINYLRNKTPDMQLISIGNKSTALDAWEYKSSDYILKPVTKEKFKKSIVHAIKQLEKEKLYRDATQIFMLKDGDSWLPLKYDDIIYFEKFNKKVNVKTQKDKYEFYSSFEHLRDMIDMDYFLQCHQGYIVNRYRMFCMNNDTIYLNGSDIPIPLSRRLKKKIMGLLKT